MFCPNCGASVDEGKAFCGGCGARLHTAGESLAEQTALMPPTIAPKHPMTLGRKLTYALVVLLVVLGGVAWWWFHRPAPAYKVQDPGIYPYTALDADGKTYKWGFIDVNGNVLIQPQWDQVAINSILDLPVAFNEELCGVKQGDKWGYINKTGNLVISPQFDQAGSFVEGLAAVQLGGQWGYIDKTGQYVVNPQFQDASYFHDGLAPAKSNGSWGFINKSGAFVIPAKFAQANSSGFIDGLAAVQLNGKVGYIDRSGRLTITTNFQEIDDFSEGLARVRLGDKWGYINTSGKLVINPQFDQAFNFYNGRAIVRIANRGGTIDKKGKFVLNPGQYNFGFARDVLFVDSSGGIGVMDTKGTWILSPSSAIHGYGAYWGSIFTFDIGDNTALVSRNGKILTGTYKGASLQTLAQDLTDETSAIQSMQMLTGAESSYNNAYPAKGFADSLSKLGPPAGASPPDQNHGGFIDATLASGTKDGYQFTVAIPEGTSTGGTNFNYLLTAKPQAGHAGRTFCADATGVTRYAAQGAGCTSTSPTL